MPEAPEIKDLNDFINKNYKNKKLISCEFLEGKNKKKSPPSFDEFQKALPMMFEKSVRHGKLFIMHFKSCDEKDWKVCIYFGLHGIFRYEDEIIVKGYDSEGTKKLHGILEFKESKNLHYFDTTGFGASFNFYNDNKKFLNILNKLAIDIYDDKFTLSKFKENFNKIKKKKLKRNEICCILMKQEYLCSGLGNYLKCEILYDAKLSPYRSINDLSNDQIEQLFKSIQKITKKALKVKGKNNFDFKVYKKNLDPDENEVTYEKTPDNRKTYWVKEVQK